MTEVISNSSLRGAINQNYLVDTTATVSPLLHIGPGAVNIGGNVVSWPGGYLGLRVNVNQLGQNDTTKLARPFTAGANGNLQWNQVYVESSGGQFVIQPVASSSTAFPGGVLPIATVGVDATLRIQQVVDKRPATPL
jgi:hypothetical protein